MEQITAIINFILTNKQCPTIDALTENTSLREDLNFDSFDLAELTVRIEEEFGVDVFEDGLVGTIGEIMAKIK